MYIVQFTIVLFTLNVTLNLMNIYSYIYPNGVFLKKRELTNITKKGKTNQLFLTKEHLTY